MNRKARIAEIEGQIAALKEQRRPLDDLIAIRKLEIEAIRAGCEHDYEIVEGEEECGTNECYLCGDRYEFCIEPMSYLSPPDARTRVRWLKSDLAEYAAKMHLLNRTRELISCADADMVKGYLEGKIKHARSELTELSEDDDP